MIGLRRVSPHNPSRHCYMKPSGCSCDTPCARTACCTCHELLINTPSHRKGQVFRTSRKTSRTSLIAVRLGITSKVLSAAVLSRKLR